MSLFFQGCCFVWRSGFRVRFLSGSLVFPSLCLIMFFLEGLGSWCNVFFFFFSISCSLTLFFYRTIDLQPCGVSGVAYGSPCAVCWKEHLFFPSCGCFKAIVFHSRSFFGCLLTLSPWAKELFCCPCETFVAVLILFEVLQ